MTRDEERAIEWECQKVLRLYYQHVDRHEFEKAVALFTPDVDWLGLGAPLKGREEILVALDAALGKSTRCECSEKLPCRCAFDCANTTTTHLRDLSRSY